MRGLPTRAGIAWGICTASIFSCYVVTSKKLLTYFSPFWLLLASGVGVVLLIPSALQCMGDDASWRQAKWKPALNLAALSGGFNLSILLSINFLPATIAAMFIGLSSVTLLIRTCMISKRRPFALEIGSAFLAVTGAYLVLEIKTGTYPIAGILFGSCALALGTSSVILTGRMREMMKAKEVVLAKQLGKITLGAIGLFYASKLPSLGEAGSIYLWALLLISGGIKMLESFTASKTAFELPPMAYRNILLLNLPIIGIWDLLFFGVRLNASQWLGIALIIISAFIAIISGEERLEAI
jgi:drug/metabolite transporter (DMT)-like permease